MRWSDRIERARSRRSWWTGQPNPQFTHWDKWLAGDWDRCAVGECDRRYGGLIQRASWGRRNIDGGADGLGMQFLTAILWNDIDEAATLLAAIEDYAIAKQAKAFIPAAPAAAEAAHEQAGV